MIAIEFSRPVQVDRLGHDERRYDIEANAQEREDLAKRYGILAVDRFTAQLRLRRVAGERVSLKGRFCADVIQSCVVSLEPVSAHLEEDFSLVYAAHPGEEMEEVEIGLFEEDPPEPIESGVIDIGEAAAEHLALALDPFPRAPNAIFEEVGEADAEPPPKASPFAALVSLKKK